MVDSHRNHRKDVSCIDSRGIHARLARQCRQALQGRVKRVPAEPALKPAQAWNVGSCCQYFNHH